MFSVTCWYTSSGYLLQSGQSEIEPGDCDLWSLRLVTATDATLMGEQFVCFPSAFGRPNHLSSSPAG
ncbi:uncharacterized protein A1O5_10339, partial [Cladophialophora psammophila CBS 110553]